MVQIVVMGVSGCGKSSLAEALASRLDIIFIEGDDLHPKANIAKMSAGKPLTDADRWPWLEAIGHALADASPSGGAVASCSALRRSYRDVLREVAGPDLVFVYLHGSRDLLQARMTSRAGHFMPTALLDSQLATLEMPGEDERVIRIDCADEIGDALAHVIDSLGVLCARF